MSILVFNAGSSSLKFGLFDAEARESLASGVIDWADGDRSARLELEAGPAGRIDRRVDVPNDSAAASCAAAAMAEIGGDEAFSPITTVAHRVVHGGAEFREHVLIDRRVKETLARLAELAPLHNPPALEAIRAAEEALPDAAQVAVFDTVFFGPAAAAGAHLPLALRLARALGRAPLRLPRHQPQVLRLSGGRDARRRSDSASPRRLPSGQRVFGDGHSRRAAGGHHHGLHALGRTDDGDPRRFDRPRHPHPPAAPLRSDDGTDRRRPAPSFGAAGRLGCFAGLCQGRGGGPGRQRPAQSPWRCSPIACDQPSPHWP